MTISLADPIMKLLLFKRTLFILGLIMAAMMGCRVNKSPSSKSGLDSGSVVFDRTNTDKNHLTSETGTNAAFVYPLSNFGEYMKVGPCTPGGPVSSATVFNLTGPEMDRLISESSTNGMASYRISEYFDFARSDSITALIWLRKAAELGFPIAQYNLGAVLTEYPERGGEGEAKYWFRKAADQGDESAKRQLLRFENGKAK